MKCWIIYSERGKGMSEHHLKELIKRFEEENE